jgi:hypothetical protein
MDVTSTVWVRNRWQTFELKHTVSSFDVRPESCIWPQQTNETNYYLRCYPSIHPFYIQIFLLKEKSRFMRPPCCVSPFRSMNQLADFYEIWCEQYSNGGHSNLALLNFLQSIITTWTHELRSGSHTRDTYCSVIKLRTVLIITSTNMRHLFRFYVERKATWR